MTETTSCAEATALWVPFYAKCRVLLSDPWALTGSLGVKDQGGRTEMPAL